MADTDWQKMARETDLKEGVPAAFDLEKSSGFLVRLGGATYACGAKCTHYGAPLEKGFLRGNILTCPWHNARFDVTSGRMNAAPALSHLKCYETKVENGDVYIRAAAKASPAMRQNTASRTFVIVGAGAAGNAAAENLRDEGLSGHLILLSASVRHNMEFMILGELLKEGVEVPFDQFRDETMDLRTLLPE